MTTARIFDGIAAAIFVGFGVAAGFFGQTTPPPIVGAALIWIGALILDVNKIGGGWRS